MDGFEGVRRAARSLRDEIMADGRSRSSAKILADAASRLELEICFVQPQDPQLKGARAFFDMQAGAICCANDGSPEERNALVGHELGHAVLDKASANCTEKDVDLSQPVELAPVGLQRVEDYGQRERRELQANVFARELLLPHAEARSCYLEERLDTVAIQKRYELPLAVVRQQLLDAVLLPAANPSPPSTKSKQRISDPSQERAIAHRGTAFLLQAGPGTGKTDTLVRRVGSLLAEAVDPSSIAIMTFSNRAAGELQERLAIAHSAEAPNIWVGTFHAFGLDLLRRYHDRLGLSADPELYDRSDGIAMLEEELPTLGLRHYRDLWNPARELRVILIAISRAKDELVDDVEYRVLAHRMLDAATNDDERVAGEKALEVARVYERYQARLREKDAVDFGDLIMRPTLLLEREPDIRSGLQQRHRHVLVDEYQDVNRASTRLLAAVAGDNGQRLWVVGDSRQAIYRFRGASSSNLKRFQREFEGAQTGPLGINFRSSSEIVNLIATVAPNMIASEGLLPLHFHAQRGASGVVPEIRHVEMPVDEVDALAAAILDLRDRGVPLREQAILCRSNSKIAEIASELEQREIPVLHLGSIFEREEIRDMLAILSLIVDRRGDSLVRVGRLARYNLSLEDIQKSLSFLRQDTSPAAGRLRIAATSARLTSEGEQGLLRLADDLDGLAAGDSPWGALTTCVLDRSRAIAEFATQTSVVERLRAIAVWQFLNFVKQPVPGKGPMIRRLLNRVRSMVLLAEERDLRRVPNAAMDIDAVRLMTVHAAKGLEFEAVHLPGMTKQSFPASRQGDQCPPPRGLVKEEMEPSRSHQEEEECLFFVAVSRARTHLLLYAAAKQRNGKNRSPSEYLGWLRTVAKARNVPRSRVSLDEDIDPVPIAWSADPRLSDKALETYDRCPRRFLYTHLLDVGTAGSPTAYTQTRDCLFKVVKWAASEAASRAVTESEVLEKLIELWKAFGPTGHAFAEDYLKIAESLMRSYVRSWNGLKLVPATSFEIPVEGATIVVAPDELATSPDHNLVLRRVRLGYRRQTEQSVDYDLLDLAGLRSGKESYAVELVHLIDDARQPLERSSKQQAASEAWLRQAVGEILGGRFPPNVNSFVCPTCPHFFICPAIPSGVLNPTAKK